MIGLKCLNRNFSKNQSHKPPNLNSYPKDIEYAFPFLAIKYSIPQYPIDIINLIYKVIGDIFE
jgi:hypothetical protein